MRRAVLWVTASVGFFSLVFASGKFAGDIASPLQILFLRYIGGLITLLIISRSSEGIRLKTILVGIHTFIFIECFVVPLVAWQSFIHLPICP